MKSHQHLQSQTEFEIADPFISYKREILAIQQNFAQASNILQQGRNTIKRIDIDGMPIVVKAFRKPDKIRGWLYANKLSSKAKKSFLHAKRLLEMGIDTPEPVAWIEQIERSRLTQSYYLTRYKEHDLTMKAVFAENSKQNIATIQQFTRFTYAMHRAGVLHLDHSANNTLLSKTGDGYQFCIIDINRMQFGSVSLEQGLNNFVRLTDNIVAMEVIASTYAKCTGADPEQCRSILFALKQKHVKRLSLKRRLKALIKPQKND